MFPSQGLRHSCTCWSSLQLYGFRMDQHNRCLPLLLPSALASSLSPSDSLLQVMIHSTAEIVTQVPHLSFSETCWLVLSVNPVFLLHVLFILHKMSVCSFSITACAFSVTVLPAFALQALPMRCKAFIFHLNISPTSASLDMPCICIISFPVHVPLCRVLIKIDFVSKLYLDERNCSYRMYEGFLWKAPENHWEVFFIALRTFL